MRNSNVKYGGIVVAIVGLAILAFFGRAYAWDEARNYSYDVGDYKIYAIIGAIMLIGGILTYIFIEE